MPILIQTLDKIDDASHIRETVFTSSVSAIVNRQIVDSESMAGGCEVVNHALVVLLFDRGYSDINSIICVFFGKTYPVYPASIILFLDSYYFQGIVILVVFQFDNSIITVKLYNSIYTKSRPQLLNLVCLALATNMNLSHILIGVYPIMLEISPQKRLYNFIVLIEHYFLWDIFIIVFIGEFFRLNRAWFFCIKITS